jgi:hypothetical protein
MLNCPHCHGLVEENAEFCPHCRQQLAAPGPAVPGGIVQPGKYLRQGWEMFKQNSGGFIAFALLFLIIQGFLNYLPRVGGLVALAISGPLYAGFYIVSAKMLQRQTPVFQDFFTGFQFFLPLLLLTGVSTLLILLGLVLLVVPGIYLMVCYLFAALIVIDQRLDFWPAMELSRRTVQTQWFGFFVFLLVLVLINLAGAVLLGIGLLVSLPVSACAVTAAYDDIFKLRSDYSGSIPQPK